MLVAILLIDAFDPTYQVDAVVVTAVLGTLGTLLGIEGLAALRNPPPNGRPDLPTSAFDRDTRDPPEA